MIIMIVYMLFIFTCGWCVCYLLFLNYQQHSRDSRLASAIRRKRLQRVRRLRSSSSRRRPDLESGGCVRKSSGRAGQLESIVDSNRQHSLLFVPTDEPDCNQCGSSRLESRPGRLCRSDEDFVEPEVDYDDEGDDNDDEEVDEEDAELFDMLDELDGFQSTNCCPSDVASCPQPPGEMRGWPEHDEQLFGPADATQDDGYDDDDDQLSLWPIVELHENPLNHLDEGQGEQDEGPEEETTRELDEWQQLNRSRLLSLDQRQREHRAAIRLVS